MPLTVQNRSGDGVHDVSIDSVVQLPDAGSSVIVNGTVQQVGVAPVAITGSPVTAPAVPGSGSTFWNIQVDAITGAATVVTSSVSDPAAALSSDGVTPKVVIFRQTLTFAVSSATLTADTSTTPDQPN